MKLDVRKMFSEVTWEQWVRFVAVLAFPVLGFILAVVQR